MSFQAKTAIEAIADRLGVALLLALGLAAAAATAVVGS